MFGGLSKRKSNARYGYLSEAIGLKLTISFLFPKYGYIRLCNIVVWALVSDSGQVSFLIPGMHHNGIIAHCCSFSDRDLQINRFDK